jgi:hypothetical protein
MKRILSLIFSVIFLAAPASAFADSSTQLGPTLAQRLTAAAALQAQVNSITTGQKLACSVLFSAPSVKVGDLVAIAWGSTGAIDPETASTSLPMWEPEGGNTLDFQQPGTWTYVFTFYSQDGTSVTCSAKIVVTQ